MPKKVGRSAAVAAITLKDSKEKVAPLKIRLPTRRKRNKNDDSNDEAAGEFFLI